MAAGRALDEVGEHRVRLVVEVEREVVERPARRSARRSPPRSPRGGLRASARTCRCRRRAAASGCSGGHGRALRRARRGGRGTSASRRAAAGAAAAARRGSRSCRRAVCSTHARRCRLSRCSVRPRIAGVHRPARRGAQIVGEPAHRHVAAGSATSPAASVVTVDAFTRSWYDAAGWPAWSSTRRTRPATANSPSPRQAWRGRSLIDAVERVADQVDPRRRRQRDPVAEHGADDRRGGVGDLLAGGEHLVVVRQMRSAVTAPR